MKETHNMKIGFIGTGVMGSSMAANLISNGYELHIYNRTKSRAQHLLDLKATWQKTPANIAKECEIIITIIGYPKDVEELYLSTDGILAHCEAGKTVIDMTTSSPKLAKNIYEKALELGVNSLDAPVSGGDIGAREAKLSIMVGGEKHVYDQMMPIFKAMGKNIVYQGEAGSGQHCKMANQIAIASNMLGVCEAIHYAEKNNLDPNVVLQSIESGAAGSWSLSNLAPRMIRQDFDPGFYIKHFIKDMNIALESCKEIDFSPQGLALARSLYQKLTEHGCEDLGTQALYKIYE